MAPPDQFLRYNVGTATVVRLFSIYRYGEVSPEKFSGFTGQINKLQRGIVKASFVVMHVDETASLLKRLIC